MDPILAKFEMERRAAKGDPLPLTLRRLEEQKPSKLLSAHAERVRLAGKGQMTAEGRQFLMNLGGPTAVHIDRALTQLAVFYKNREYVADLAMPVVRIPNKSDTYFEFDVTTMQLVANTQIAGNRGRPGEVAAFPPSSGNQFAVTDHGLMDFISSDEEANADPPLVPRMTATRVLTNYLLLARERRVATVVTTAGNYGASTTALAGPAQWNNYLTSTPINDLLIAKETPLITPNVMFIDPLTWITLRQHPQVLQYVTGRPGYKGGATPAFVDEEFVAKALGLDMVVQCRAKYISTAEGLAATSSYVWGKFCALLRVEDQPDKRETTAFGYTFRFGAFETRVIPEFIAGVRGGNWIKVTHSDAEKKVAGGNSSYLIETPIP